MGSTCRSLPIQFLYDPARNMKISAPVRAKHNMSWSSHIVSVGSAPLVGGPCMCTGELYPLASG